jgi:hypothetical protein
MSNSSVGEVREAAGHCLNRKLNRATNKALGVPRDSSVTKTTTKPTLDIMLRLDEGGCAAWMWLVLIEASAVGIMQQIDERCAV